MVEVLKRKFRKRKTVFVYGAFTRSGGPFQAALTNEGLSFCFPPAIAGTNFSYNPQHQNWRWVWTLPVSLAATKGMRFADI